MILQHLDQQPQIDPSAYVAPNALICGNVRIGKNARIMFGAQLIAENSPITIGAYCIVLENAVIRGTENNPVTIGNNCLIGPNSHLAGCTLEDEVFIATGASIFHGATIKHGAEVRINGVVHLKSVLGENEIVPINWVAVGDPAQIFPPQKHEEIWAVQKTLDFTDHVYGLPEKHQGSGMSYITRAMAQRLKHHSEDRIVE